MITIALILTFVAALYLYFTRTFNYWKERGVKYQKPVMLFGNSLREYLQQRTATQLAVEAYNEFPDEKVVGFFTGMTPELVIRDPVLVKRILMTDFNHFHNRGINFHKYYVEPLMRNLFFVDGDLWRLLRQRMTGAFTSGKLRAMFPLIVERAERLQARALLAAAAGAPLDARDLMARYTTDFIGACGFGLDADTLNDERSEFRKLGVRIFEIYPSDAIKVILKDIFPKLLKDIILFSRVESDITALVKHIMQQRNYQPSGRHDFIDLMLECQKKGVMTAESLEKVNADGTPAEARAELTEELIVAQVFVFFAAGFETSSSATSFTLHQLAFHPEVQRKVQDEIDTVLRHHGNKLSYDAVKEMTYLSWAFKEGMRMFPSLGFLYRECTKKYTFHDLNFSIDEGVRIMIPLQALHNDPQYFDEPEKFRPERFNPENCDDNATKFIYAPFGDGPRNCIGSRLGEMQSLAGLAAVLARFTVEPGPTTRRHPAVDPKSSVVQSIRGGLPLMFRERKLT